jgi:hypothetical protein
MVAIDGHFYAVCLVHAMKAAAIVCKHTHDSSLERAIETFEATLPDYKDVRNLLEHWDAYATGKGLLQKDKVVPRRVTSGRKWSHDPDTGKMDFTVNIGPFSLPLESSFDALRSVVRATLVEAERLRLKTRGQERST